MFERVVDQVFGLRPWAFRRPASQDWCRDYIPDDVCPRSPCWAPFGAPVGKLAECLRYHKADPEKCGAGVLQELPAHWLGLPVRDGSRLHAIVLGSAQHGGFPLVIRPKGGGGTEHGGGGKRESPQGAHTTRARRANGAPLGIRYSGGRAKN